ncbi:riboflavin synthase [Bdellovibrio bacteriovorus]|uniref:Riboflavin synthase n=2 Tax=Bdellovibrio bacteriovorus TaxID=959 RepID=Q6MIV7_BDEBA|nr:riboflavin synthase [Bdellovibrio bacteriovorus]AFY02646.1 riboflavin synthase subunit alpha [Bdellovibrio bacteriovorus str. Tiberius]CAE80806.1 ribB [Bdellovibrio bacteriovorus HD100]
MFSGIVESVMPIESSEELTNAYRIKIKKPSEFNDIKLGDSIACDGACLTVEAFDDQTMTFALAAETIKVLEWNPQSWLGKQVNLERSLRFGDRIHGHLVTGHVDSLGTVTRADLEGESFFLDVNVAETILPYVWKKGSVTLNGVSLTVNELQGSVVSVCLIPETLKRTNLGLLKPGSRINVEPDYMARAIQRSLEVRKG